MSSAKLCTVVTEEEGDGRGGNSSISVEVSRSGIQPNCNPYYRFLDSNSDSGYCMDAEPEFIDFFDRDSYDVEFRLSSNQRLSSSGGFNIWEEDIELGLGIGSGSGEAVVHREIDSDPVDVGTGLTSLWDDEETMVVDEEFEWENLQNAINLVEAEFSEVNPSRDDDWQALFDANNFFEDMMDLDLGLYLPTVYEDGEIDGEFNSVLAQTFDSDGVMGRPPTSKRVIDNLPTVVITSEELRNGEIVCAICKDEIVVEEKAKKLPCKHYYHGECIIPWLGIRNTCPVCRYELPTDDLEYEMNKRLQRRG